MMKSSLRLFSLLAGFAFLAFSVPNRATGCDICALGRGTTPLSKEIPSAPIVVFGHITNARPAADGINGRSDFHVETILKDEPGFLKGKSSLTILRYVPPDPKLKFLLIASVREGQVDVYRSF